MHDTILTHSCNKLLPKTLEQKVLATADAMSHFHNGFWFWIAFNKGKTNLKFNDFLKFIKQKINKDIDKKIFFPQEKKELQKYKQLLKLI